MFPSTVSSISSDPYPHSPSPPDPRFEPAVRLVDAQERLFSSGYYNPDPSSQPFAQPAEDISAVDFSLLEQQYLSLSQGSSPDHSPTRATKGSLPHTMQSKQPMHRTLSETFGIRTDFLDKHKDKDLDDFTAQTPSPTEENSLHGSSFSFAAADKHKIAPRREAPAAMNDRSFLHRHLESPSTPLGKPLSFPNPPIRSRSIQPLFADEFSDSPGMRGHSLPPDDTPTLRPDLTLLTPVVTNGDLFDEEAVDIESDGDVDDAEPPPDSYMTKPSDDFDDETDVEPDCDEGDLFNSIIPLGFNVEDEYVDERVEPDVGLFGGRIDDQYWRHEDCPPNGNGQSYYYPRSGESTPRQQHHPLPSTPMGLGIKLSAT